MRVLLAALLLAAAALANAQEGFPLDGTWRGEREAAGSAPATIVMVLQWDGQKVTGVINPGPKAIQIADARLIPAGWNKSSVGDLDRLGPRVDHARHLLTVPLQNHHDGGRGAARGLPLATPRAVERKTFLCIRQSGSCKQQCRE